MKMFCVLALAGAMAIPVASQDDSNGESRVIAMEKAWNQAFKSRDGKALGGMLHDSIVLVNDDGSLESKAGFLTEIDKAKPSANQQTDPESISVRIFGNVAIATGVFRESGIEKGKAFARRNRFVDTWIHDGESWKCVAASATPILH
ncbi:MAG TPA: nuclear transport factor 2 family protein [Candidatus Sulfotelmatobacter sp.]